MQYPRYTIKNFQSNRTNKGGRAGGICYRAVQVAEEVFVEHAVCINVDASDSEIRLPGDFGVCLQAILSALDALSCPFVRAWCTSN